MRLGSPGEAPSRLKANELKRKRWVRGESLTTLFEWSRSSMTALSTTIVESGLTSVAIATGADAFIFDAPMTLLKGDVLDNHTYHSS